MIYTMPQPADLEKQIDKAWVEFLNSRGLEKERAAYMRFATLIGLRRQPKRAK